MEQMSRAIRQLITVPQEEMDLFLQACHKRTFTRKSLLSEAGRTPNEIFFIKRGIVRVMTVDRKGTEHTIHFALEDQFIADYASFLQQQPSAYSLQALEKTETVVLPRSAVAWGYQHMTEGEKLGRLIAEYYFIYNDNRIRNLYSRTPKERYDNITQIFPNIHNRVPQHMIASYLGVTPIHLSRLKRNN